MSVRITTWNVNSLKVRLGQVLDFLAQDRTDVLCLQELKMQDTDIPREDFAKAGWHIEAFGQKTYNGVAIVSRQPPESPIVRNIPGFNDDQSRLLALSLNLKEHPLRVICGYFPNGETPDSPKFTYKLNWLEALEHWLPSELAEHPRLLLCGDFNIAPKEGDASSMFKNSVLCHAASRQAFERLTALGLKDAFELQAHEPKTYTWWDYRMGAFKRNLGARIDHILLTESLAQSFEDLAIGKDVRALEKPSDHAPVTVTLSA